MPAGDAVQRTLIPRVSAAPPAGVETITSTGSLADDSLNASDLNPEDDTDTDITASLHRFYLTLIARYWSAMCAT